eukprot:3276793-Amphidinium_carterae.1
MAWLGCLLTSRGELSMLGRQFILGLLARDESRAIVAELQPHLQQQLVKSLHTASQAAASLAKRPPVSDTTLKFRHEATLALPWTSTSSYDLDLDLGARICKLMSAT